MLHGCAPWAGTGYGQQLALLGPALASLGHEVIYSTYYGLQGAPLEWKGFLVLPVGQHKFGSDILNERVKREKVDLTITLIDIWALEPQPLRYINVAHWMPVDCEPMGSRDRACLEVSGAIPIAISRHGEKMMQDKGFKPLYVPHGIDTSIFSPHPGLRSTVREEMGIQDEFVIGINATNKDPWRKGFNEQLTAFSMLHSKYPDTRLLIHSALAEPGAIELAPLIESRGITKAVIMADQYSYIQGTVTAEHLSAWYNCLDLYSGCAYGEGFGIPIVEAQACGVPVAVTDCSGMREVCGAGWKVPGQRWWNPGHNADWTVPFISQIFRVYEQAYKRGPAYQKKAAAARKFALQYDKDKILADHWVPALKEIEEIRKPFRPPEWWPA